MDTGGRNISVVEEEVPEEKLTEFFHCFLEARMVVLEAGKSLWRHSTPTLHYRTVQQLVWITSHQPTCPLPAAQSRASWASS